MKITHIFFDWFYTMQGEECKAFHVGCGGVVSISDTSMNGRVCYDVQFADGTVHRIFNPNRVVLEPEDG